MKTVLNLAWANTKYHRVKNILSGLAIVFTTILVYLIISIGMGMVNTQNYAVNSIYPTFHTMYRNVSEPVKDQLILNQSFEAYGLRQDIGEIPIEDGRIVITHFDKQALKLSKGTIKEGKAPQKDNEIALSKGGLLSLGFADAKLGDTIPIAYQRYEKEGLSIAQTNDFKLVGILPEGTQTKKNKVLSMLVSENFTKSVIPETERTYRVLVRFRTNEASTTDEIENISKKIAEDFDISEADTVMNSDYLFANYVDPSFFKGMIFIVAIILIVGALTIYSIYYVSMINKVQEYGKLRALGANKKQIRIVVLVENLLVALIAIPIGLIISIFSAKFFFQQIMSTYTENEMMIVIQKIIAEGKVSLFIPWIAILAIVVTLLTVVISSLKPMRFASKIMPVEAMNYAGKKSKKRKHQKSFTNLNLRKLAETNLFRNKKRTFTTIISLSLIGILFIIVATIFTCMNPAQIARDAIAEDFRIETDAVSGDKMNPQQEWTVIQQNNPLSEDTLQEIEQLSGVQKIYPQRMMSFEAPAIMSIYGDGALTGFLKGFDEEQFKTIKSYVKKEDVSFADLLTGNKVIATEVLVKHYPEIKVGSKIKVELFAGDQSHIQELTVAAIADVPEGIVGRGTLLTSNQFIKEQSPHNTTYSIDVQVQPQKMTAIKEKLTNIINRYDYLTMDSFTEIEKEWESITVLMSGAVYGIMIILGIVGVMNLINTTIDSILSRKKQLGVMQAIGMSNRQMRRMLQGEGLFYAVGIIALSVFFGSILGYGAYIYAVTNRVLQIKTYAYPTIQVVLLILIVIIVQLILTFATTKMVTKETIISRIHYSE
ncbi:ABC transporter permease [Enterococcus alishanensis]|uniref:ABC transporter permease n=1 Tax=Enterococcus alishanensis TaxID=1303817 RepID=A0ABS6T9C0_9ENTE|nr:ABC transporter permease [Enterococcus alishanensis]MBV7389498.1 ABC transporter permease [Enterococcus alishanensis]